MTERLSRCFLAKTRGSPISRMKCQRFFDGRLWTRSRSLNPGSARFPCPSAKSFLPSLTARHFTAFLSPQSNCSHNDHLLYLSLFSSLVAVEKCQS